MDPPTEHGKVFMRTIYLWHVLALFTEDKRGFMKLTEGMADNRIEEIIKEEGGIWIWMCNSKSTDIEKGKNKRSYIWGAVYVTGILENKEFKKKYQRGRLKGEYEHSKGYKYQGIIPDNRYYRRELKEPIEIVGGGEMRIGIWEPKEGSDIYDRIGCAKFV
jgi:hypothetical protein